MSWPKETVRFGISLHDADSHEMQLKRVSTVTDPVEGAVEPGEVTLQFSNEANSWSYSRSIQNAMVAIANAMEHQQCLWAKIWKWQAPSE